MDIQALAKNVTEFLAPLLPALLHGAAGEMGKEVGNAILKKAKLLWDKLRPKVETSPAAQEAIADVAANPQNERAKTALLWQMEKLLAADPTLAAEINRLWGEIAATGGTTVIASGDRSVAIGGNVSGSTIITGNGNKVGR